MNRDFDRWVEIDIDWFGTPPWQRTIGEFVERMAPLWAGERELRGVCLNVGWLADIVTEWTGDPAQPLPLRSRRYARWKGLTYADLRAFVAQLRERGAAAGIGDLKVGVLVAGVGEVVWPRETGSMYDLYSDWYDRHPELYPLDISGLPAPDLDPRVPLAADTYPYATRPGGVRAGDAYADLLGAQWGSVSRFLGLDLVHLRDGFPGPLLYNRNGPYGATASPDPAQNQTWTDELIRIFRRIKEANPDALVMSYSSGVGATAEWMAGCIDFEAVVADGALDIWIDQTWGGAWQDWWDDLWKGWTFQHTDLLLHGAMVRGANRRRATGCKHYKLIETWDGWEPWDTLHRVPGKLRWAMWAYAHGAVLTPDGPEVPEGTYLSWANDRNGRLMSAGDAEFVRRHLDAAEASAARLEAVYGPLLVHDRASLARQYQTDPSANAAQWIEDQAAMVMKFGAPVLASTRTEWLPETWQDGLLLQLPGALDAAALARLDGAGGPVVAAGRADLIHPELLARAGVAAGPLREAGYRLGHPTAADPDLRREDAVHMPPHAEITAADRTEVRYTADGVPTVAGTERYLLWQPPDFAVPADPQLPRSQLGTVGPYVALARALGERAAAAGGVTTLPVPARDPVTFQCWRSGGTVHVLLGNLETGWIGDARHPRRVTLVLPRGRLGLGGGGYALVPQDRDDGAPVRPEPGGPAGELRFTVEVPPEGSLVYLVTPEEEAA